MDKNYILRGKINSIILSTLFECDKYGYEIRKELESKTAGQVVLKESTLYSSLRRLENSGYISAYYGDIYETNGGRRRYYTLTEKGKITAKSNHENWEYSRTVMDKLISDKEIDLQTAKPPTLASDKFAENFKDMIPDEHNIYDDSYSNQVQMTSKDEKLKKQIIEFNQQQKEFAKIREQERQNEIQRLKEIEEKEKQLALKEFDFAQQLLDQQTKLQEQRLQSEKILEEKLSQENKSKELEIQAKLESVLREKLEKELKDRLEQEKQNLLAELEKEKNTENQLLQSTNEQILQQKELAKQEMQRLVLEQQEQLRQDRLKLEQDIIAKEQELLAKIKAEKDEVGTSSLLKNSNTSANKLYGNFAQSPEKITKQKNFNTVSSTASLHQFSAQNTFNKTPLTQTQQNSNSALFNANNTDMKTEQNNSNYLDKVNKLLSSAKSSTSVAKSHSFQKSVTRTNEQVENKVNLPKNDEFYRINSNKQSPFAINPYNPVASMNQKRIMVYKNKILLSTALFSYLLFLLMCAAVYILFEDMIVNLAEYMLISICIAGLVPIYFLMLKFIWPNKKTPAIFDFRQALLNSVLCFCYLFLTIMAINLVFKVQFENIAEITQKIFIPTIFSFMIVIFTCVYGLLFFTEKYHTTQ